MKKILIAMNNRGLLEKLKRCGKYKVHDYDIDTKEDVIEYLSKYDTDILITTDFLKGRLTKEEYIRNIREINKNVKIIICVEYLDEIYKNFLFSNNVFNIIEGDEIDFCAVFNMIESLSKMVVLKNNNKTVKETINNNNKVNVLTKQKICVFGTSRCR